MAEAFNPLFVKIRERALAWQDPAAPPGSPSGIIMETGYPEGLVMLVVMSTGTVDLYFSKGGGIMGGGAHPGPKVAARELAVAAAHMAEKMPIALDRNPPNKGATKLYVLVDGIVRCAEGRESDFGEGRLKFSPLFHAAHAVITALQQVPPPPPAEHPEF